MCKVCEIWQYLEYMASSNCNMSSVQHLLLWLLRFPSRAWMGTHAKADMCGTGSLAQEAIGRGYDDTIIVSPWFGQEISQ
jgi:hypothetical protein